MALHQLPKGQDGQHQRDEQCPCKPSKVEGHATVGTGRNRHPYQGVIIRHQVLPAAAEIAARVDAPQLDDAGPVEADCGHIVVDVDGEPQHHEIPDDDAQHAPTTECGCGPQRVATGEHVVIVHADQGADDVSEQLYREVFGG